MGSATGPDPASWRLTRLAIGVAIGVWAALPPYVGPALDTARRVEFVDHPLPALVLGVVAIRVSRPGSDDANALFVGGLLAMLAGVWQAATHVPLVAQAARGAAPWLATISHSLPSLAMLAVGLTWTVQAVRSSSRASTDG